MNETKDTNTLQKVGHTSCLYSYYGFNQLDFKIVVQYHSAEGLFTTTFQPVLTYEAWE